MAAAPPTSAGARGVIVNTASTSASEGQVGQSIYAASKAAVGSMTLPLARELADHGIRVNTIAPGLFDTPILGDASDRLRHRDRLEPHLVFPRRAGEPAEFAALVLAIIEDDYINGEVIRIDGATRMPPR
jgi:NAD(P)-dependent dehydrogenase (short-subunit alcohol dehydrogenase family)